MFSLFGSGISSSFKGSIISRASSTTSLLSIKSLKYASISGAYFWIKGVILELVIKSVVLRFEGNSKKITNKKIKPLDRPNKTPRNLSKPDAPDHFISLLINLISKPPTKINTINIKGKSKMVRGRKAYKSGYKKAIVTLKKGQSIDLTTGKSALKIYEDAVKSEYKDLDWTSMFNYIKGVNKID